MEESTQVALLKARDYRTLDYVYDVYAPPLYGIICRIVGGERIAEELLQDTFIQVWETIDTYDPQKSRLFTWMMQIARNRATDYLRSQKSAQIEETDVIQKSSCTGRSLPDQLDRLPPEQREIINLVYFAGYSQVEAAKKLNVPLETIKSRLRSAMIELRKLLQISP